MGRKCFPHVLVASVFLIYKVVRGCYVIVPVCLQTSDRVVLFEAVVFDKPFEQILAVRHLLKAGEKARLALTTLVLFDCVTHIWMTTNIRYAVTCLRVGVQDLTDQVLALGTEELGHLIISRHNLLVKIRSLWILEWKVSGYHGIKNNA